MKIIGVTGGVGAGKSTVLSYLEQTYGAKVILADLVGHQVMEPGKEAYEEIRNVFGDHILEANGVIDRKALGAIVFADAEKLSRLNAIVHPAVRREILGMLEDAKEKNYPYAVVEAALFLEEKYNAFCDETWYIYTNEETRRARLKESRGYTDERISQILANQKSHEEFFSRCDWMIDNNGTSEETQRQIDRRMRQ